MSDVKDELTDIIGTATARVQERLDQRLPSGLPYADEIQLAIQLADQGCGADRDTVWQTIRTLRSILMSPEIENKEYRPRLLAVYNLLRAVDEALLCAASVNQRSSVPTSSHIAATRTFAAQAVTDAEQLPPIGVCR